jgi:hypothetical protein
MNPGGELALEIDALGVKSLAIRLTDPARAQADITIITV